MSLGCFIDDRTFWSTGPNVVADVILAARRTADFDRDIGAVWNQKKNYVFATTLAAGKRSASAVPELGPLKTKFKLLGVDVSTTKVAISRGAVSSRAGPVAAKAQRQLQRIKKALPGNIARRIKFTRSIILSKISWGSEWMRTSPARLGKFARMIGTTIVPSDIYLLQIFRLCMECCHWC